MPEPIPDAAVEAAARAGRGHSLHRLNVRDPWDETEAYTREAWRNTARAYLAAATPHIAAQERQRVADEIDLPYVMAHLLHGSRADMILADRINVAVGASRVRRIESGQ